MRPSGRERQFDACEPENRLVARTLERKLEDALADGRARAASKLIALEHARPAAAHRRRSAERSPASPVTCRELWAANTTTDRDRKQLLRTLISEIVVTVARPSEHRRRSRSFWEGGARSELRSSSIAPRPRQPPHSARTRSS